MPILQCREQSWHCTLEVISHISKYSVFSHAADLFLQLLAETGWVFGSFLSLPSVIRDLGVFQIGGSVFLTVSLRMSSSSWTVECGRPCILKSFFPAADSPELFGTSVAIAVATGFPRTLRSLCFSWSADVLASKLYGSWRPWYKFGLSTALCDNLGDWFTLLHNSSADF